MKTIVLSLLLLCNFLYGSNRILLYKGKSLLNGNGNGIEIHHNYVETGFKINKLGGVNEEYLKSITEKNGKIYIGSGLTGKIYTFYNNKFTLFSDSIDANVNIIRIIKKNIYAGTSPDGYFVRFNASGKKIFKTGEYSVNDIIKFGNKILLATSSNGKILSFSRDKFRLFHQFAATSVNRLILSKNGIYAFCSEPASVFLLNKQGKIIHSYQFEEDQIADVCIKNGYVYVAVNRKNGIGSVYSEIYKLSPDFSSCLRLAKLRTGINSIAYFENYIIFSAGNEGLIYVVSPKSYTPAPIKIREAQDLSFGKFLKIKNKLYAISSHKGDLYEIETANEGYYITKPIRFDSPVAITGIFPIGFKNEQLYFKTGNTSLGDSIAVPWKRYSSGMIRKGGNILFLQLKTHLFGKNRFYGFKITYTKKTPSPVIDSLVLSPPGVLYTDGFFTGYNKRVTRSKTIRLSKIGFILRNNAKEMSNSKRSIIVYMKSPSKGLSYSLHLKNLYLGRSFNSVKNDSNHFFIVNTDRYPDGTYQATVYVKSQDGHSTIAQTAPFLIDNSPPAVVKYELKGNTLNFVVSDTTGIYEIEYTVNGSHWKRLPLNPEQIFKKNTRVKVSLNIKPVFVIIKLTDMFGNVGYFTIRNEE